jgi:hypothetical protein
MCSKDGVDRLNGQRFPNKWRYIGWSLGLLVMTWLSKIGTLGCQVSFKYNLFQTFKFQCLSFLSICYSMKYNHCLSFLFIHCRCLEDKLPQKSPRATESCHSSALSILQLFKV